MQCYKFLLTSLVLCNQIIHAKPGLTMQVFDCHACTDMLTSLPHTNTNQLNITQSMF